MEKLLPSSADRKLREYGADAEGTIFAANLEISGFASSFHHCVQLTDYVSQFVTANRREPDRLNSMLSMCLNELLEIAYRYHGGEGALQLEVRRARSAEKLSGPLVIVACIPVDDSSLATYEWCRAQLTRPDAAENYRELARGGFEDGDHKTSFLELASVYGIDLAVYPDADHHRVTIIIAVLDAPK